MHCAVMLSMVRMLVQHIANIARKMFLVAQRCVCRCQYDFSKFFSAKQLENGFWDRTIMFIASRSTIVLLK